MLTVYGQGSSQPVRPIVWLCLIKELPFELCDIPNQSIGPNGPLAELNPTGQVPTIRDGDFVLYESPAILAYLCRKHGWEDFYPSGIEERAYIDQYLHFHHNRTRKITHELMAPHVWAAFLDQPGFVEKAQVIAPHVIERARDPRKLELGQAAVSEIFRVIERGYFCDTTYLCSDLPSIADLECYEEIAQLRWANLFEFASFPKLARWLDAMAEIPRHETAHRYNIVLDDIQTQPNTLERFVLANVAAVDALEEAGIAITTLDGAGHRELAVMLQG